MSRELLLLSPYTPPTQHALMLGDDETACWLNGWTALWHPAALRHASAPPRWLGVYDQDEPGPNQLVAMPEFPPPYVAADWGDRLTAKGGDHFSATPDRKTTLENLRRALAQLGDDVSAFDAEPQLTRACFGLGLGYQVIETLFEAMERERTLDRTAFWADVQSFTIEGLKAAAQKLLATRQTLYDAPIQLLDLCLSELISVSLTSTARPTTFIGPGRKPDLPIPAHDPDSSDPPPIEICGGPLIERADDLLPLESQIWNLRRGRAAVATDPSVFAQRLSAWHAQSPMVLHRAGYSKCVFVPFDEAKLRDHRAAVIQWPAADGRQVEAFCRAPVPAHVQTCFHLGHDLHQTIMNDSNAVLAIGRRDRPAGDWYDDWLALSELAPVLGTWTTIGHFLRDASIGEYASTAAPDDFSIDHLERLVTAGHARPVSGFARHWRNRRRVDAAWTNAALLRGLGEALDASEIVQFEERVERGEEFSADEVHRFEQSSAMPLVNRLLRQSQETQPGLLLLNSCGFARRVALERDDFKDVAMTDGPIKAAQRDADGKVRLVADVPALGFAWLPRAAQNHSLAIPARKEMKLADSNVVRNEFFEAEIDPKSGGLRAFRDLKTRENRIGQQLVFQPGSTMTAKSLQVTASGPAMGEIVAEGALRDEHQNVLSTFRQRYRAWVGRPILEMKIELFPEREPTGSPWHAYFGARFAWRDERATLLRGNCNLGSLTTHTRPVTPEFLELRSGKFKTLILPQGLPFHQRHAGRMLDVILIPPGETARSFSLALSFDREYPAQTAWGLNSPIAAIPVDRGPPAAGATGWLAHLDSPNLLLHNLRPVGDQPAIIARLQEISGFAGSASMRFARNPSAAEMLEPDGTTMMPLTLEGDAVQFDYGANDLIDVRVEF